MSDDLALQAERLLREHGLHAHVTVRGFDGSIAAVAAPVQELEAVARLAPKLRELGFQYVAIDLGVPSEGPADPPGREPPGDGADGADRDADGDDDGRTSR